MESNEKSPIIERLCKFIEISGLTTSQFADKAGIPRPSMSQMLHGRNKSLNNHVLSKLREAFPELNIVWLLFGEGNMLASMDSEMSAPQNTLFSSYPTPSNSVNQHINVANEEYEDAPAYGSNSSSTPSVTDDSDFEAKSSPYSLHENKKEASGAKKDRPESDIISKILNSKVSELGPTKKIASIIVLFTDNSFETFLPSSES